MSSAPSLTGLELEKVSVAYDDVTVVKHVSFSLQEGQIGCLLGPSGCGKSTLLRTIAGFENPISGSISLFGKLLSSFEESVAPEHRQMGMVFQDIALFPHLTIGQNIAFGIRHLSKAEQKNRVEYLLGLVNLSGFEHRYPDSLSGGQQQRIALVRAIAPKPKLLLMDEPFSGLDAKLREELVPDVRAILLQEKISAILVTHDQMEAFAIADHIAIMNQGQIHQAGTAYEIYHSPATAFVASFIGHSDFINATVVDDMTVQSSLGLLKGAGQHGFASGAEVDLLIRPDDIVADDNSHLHGLVMSRWFRGAHFLYRVQLEKGQTVYCLAPAQMDYSVGETIGLKAEIDNLLLFAKDKDEH